MTRTVFCEKLKKEAEGLATPPYPGALGRKIYEHISKEAWDAWLAQQTMLINEYRLNLFEQKVRAYLQQEMEKFLFGEGSATPSGFTPPK
jgi:Fe-S cluster biosynthesis and repair protein YggX